jgi:hypothetical protein
MAGAQLNPSRRALLGAALGFPFLPLDGGGQEGVALGPGAGSEARRFTSAATPSLPSPIEGEGNWGRALAAYRAAQAAVRAEERVTAGASAEEEAAREEVYGARLDAMYDAPSTLLRTGLRRLLRVAAPDVGALAVKIDLMIDHEAATLTGGDACLAAIRRDARRLAQAAEKEDVTN